MTRFDRKMTLSPELATVVGQGPMSRQDVVAKLWLYIKGHGCQDPTDKRVIVCDALLRAVMGEERVSMFAMNKHLSRHLTAT